MAPNDPRLARIMAAQYAAFLRDPHPNLLALLDAEDVKVWHFLAVGLDAPYRGGEYLFRLTAPDDFPARPPRFEFLTPNGLYMPGGPICISVGEFHHDDAPGPDGAHGWRPALGMAGFAVQVVNGLICHEELASGIRITHHPAPMKDFFARASRTFNETTYPLLAHAFAALAAEQAQLAPSRAYAQARLEAAAEPSAPAIAGIALSAGMEAAPRVFVRPPGVNVADLRAAGALLSEPRPLAPAGGGGATPPSAAAPAEDEEGEEERGASAPFAPEPDAELIPDLGPVAAEDDQARARCGQLVALLLGEGGAGETSFASSRASSVAADSPPASPRLRLAAAAEELAQGVPAAAEEPAQGVPAAAEEPAQGVPAAAEEPAQGAVVGEPAQGAPVVAEEPAQGVPAEEVSRTAAGEQQPAARKPAAKKAVTRKPAGAAPPAAEVLAAEAAAEAAPAVSSPAAKKPAVPAKKPLAAKKPAVVSGKSEALSAESPAARTASEPGTAPPPPAKAAARGAPAAPPPARAAKIAAKAPAPSPKKNTAVPPTEADAELDALLAEWR